jgi:hypothetical protein
MQRRDGCIRQQVRDQTNEFNSYMYVSSVSVSHAFGYQRFFLFRFLGLLNADTVKITYVEADGSSKTVDAEIGQNLMDVAHANDIELEGTYLHCTVRFDELCEECQIMCGISRVWLGLVFVVVHGKRKKKYLYLYIRHS